MGMPASWPNVSCEAMQRSELSIFLVLKDAEANFPVSSCAPFIYDACKSPETLAIVSRIAGVDLVPAMDLEIGHINLSMSSEEKKSEELAAAAEKEEHEADCIPQEDDRPIVDWHTDSYPFVCVTMLSDCTDMIGGETALRKGNGEVVKVRGPQMVSFAIDLLY